MSGSAGRRSFVRKLLEFWRGVLGRRGYTRGRRATVGPRSYFEMLESRLFLSGGVEGAFVDSELLACKDFSQAPVAAEIGFLEEAHQTVLLTYTN